MVISSVTENSSNNQQNLAVSCQDMALNEQIRVLAGFIAKSTLSYSQPENNSLESKFGLQNKSLQTLNLARFLILTIHTSITQPIYNDSSISKQLNIELSRYMDTWIKACCRDDRSLVEGDDRFFPIWSYYV